MRILVRDINDPAERLTQGVRGGVDIIDLSNICSCAFISTQDTGRLLDHGRFMIEGVSPAATYAAVICSCSDPAAGRMRRSG